MSGVIIQLDQPAFFIIFEQNGVAVSVFDLFQTQKLLVFALRF
jgi:hypothetical protein